MEMPKSKEARLFLLGRQTSLLEQALGLVVERYTMMQSKRDVKFVVKLGETLFRVEEFCKELSSVAAARQRGRREQPTGDQQYAGKWKFL
jgi:hypothetical protein